MDEGAARRSTRLTLPAKATSPSRARRFVGDTIRAWYGADTPVDDATLVVSELVTNALLHARTPMSVVLVDEGPDQVRLAVTDGSAQAPQERHFSAESGTGRGLRLLDSVSEEWGVEAHPNGKTVWCRLSLGGDAAGFADFDVDAVEAL